MYLGSANQSEYSECPIPWASTELQDLLSHVKLNYLFCHIVVVLSTVLLEFVVEVLVGTIRAEVSLFVYEDAWCVSTRIFGGDWRLLGQTAQIRFCYFDFNSMYPTYWKTTVMVRKKNS